MLSLHAMLTGVHVRRTQVGFNYGFEQGFNDTMQVDSVRAAFMIGVAVNATCLLALWYFSWHRQRTSTSGAPAAMYGAVEVA